MRKPCEGGQGGERQGKRGGGAIEGRGRDRREREKGEKGEGRGRERREKKRNKVLSNFQPGH